MQKINLSIVSTSRADIGIYSPLLIELNQNHRCFNTTLIYSGTNLFDGADDDLQSIKLLKYLKLKNLQIFSQNYKHKTTNYNFSNALKRFDVSFAENKIDLLVVLGDRFEMFAAAISAYNNLIPIAHIHGGEVTSGSLDDGYRHAISKLSNYHFCATKKSRQRIMQLGEHRKYIFHIGSLGVENILKKSLLSKKELKKSLGLPDKKICLAVFHPEKDFKEISYFVSEIINILINNTNLIIVATGSNIDRFGIQIETTIKSLAAEFSDRLFFFNNLGSTKYLSLVNSSEFLIGNSSSGIIEAPSLKTPSINVGIRQLNRENSSSVIHVDWNLNKIRKAIKSTMSNSKFQFKNPYYKPKPAYNMVKKIQDLKPFSTTKKFNDIHD